jgi:hypothetical protein
MQILFILIMLLLICLGIHFSIAIARKHRIIAYILFEACMAALGGTFMYAFLTCLGDIH